MKPRLPDPSEPLVRVTTYMYPQERQNLRELAAAHGMSMSEYMKHLIAEARRGLR